MTRKSAIGGGHAISSPVLLVVAALILAVLSVQVAIAGQGDGKKASHGKKHAKSSKQQLRELRQELQALRGQVAVLQGQSGASATPTGAAGGDLMGSYPNPQIAPGVITAADVNPLNVDGAAGTASLRTLGGGANQAKAGNAGPTGAATGGLTGTYPNPTIATGAVHASDLTSTVVRSADGVAPDNSTSNLTVSCDPGERLLSGGSELDIILATDVVITYDAPNSTTAWLVRVVNRPGDSGATSFHAYALCLQA